MSVAVEPASAPNAFFRSLLTLLEVLIILPVRPTPTPRPARFFKLLDNEAVFEDRTFERPGPIEIPAPGGGKHLVALHVGIRQGIDIDRPPPAVIRENTRLARCIPAVEGRSIVGGHGGVVVAAVVLDRRHPLDRKSMLEKALENSNHLIGEILVDEQRSC